MKNYEGNEKEFKQYNEILKKDFEGITFYYDNNIKKYFGNVVNNLYEGRGILYNESDNFIKVILIIMNIDMNILD